MIYKNLLPFEIGNELAYFRVAPGNLPAAVLGSLKSRLKTPTPLLFRVETIVRAAASPRTKIMT